MESMRICPLLSVVYKQPVGCKEEDCEWWDEVSESCFLRKIANELEYIACMLEKEASREDKEGKQDDGRRTIVDYLEDSRVRWSSEDSV
ncbi:MAG: hypothetical protein ACXQTL_02270 [Methanosarcinales archaeon]